MHPLDRSHHGFDFVPLGSQDGKVWAVDTDNNGSPGDETNTFKPGDHTVHCLAKLNSPKEGIKIKFAWWIVDAGGTKNEKIKEIDYTTSADDNVVHGHLTVPRDWPTGKYKCEVYVNGVLDKTVEYWVA